MACLTTGRHGKDQTYQDRSPGPHRSCGGENPEGAPGHGEAQEHSGLPVLQAWQAQQYDVNRDVVYRQSTSNYKKDCHLIEYTSDNQMVRYWELKGCWITNLTEQPFDATNGNTAREIQASIQYDRAIPHMPDEELVALEP